VLKNVPKSEGFLHCYYCPYLSLIIWGNFQPYIWILTFISSCDICATRVTFYIVQHLE